MAGLLAKFNWVDIVALILLVRITYISSRIGVGKQILPLILLVLILSISLYNYRGIAGFFIGQYGFPPAICNFFSYFLMTLIFSMVYYIAARLTGFCLMPGDIEPGGIEKVGGTLLGFGRSVFVIGMVLIGLLLVPIKFIERSIKESHMGHFYISTNLRIYATVANLILKGEKASHREELTKLFSRKKKYLFSTE